MTPPLKTVAIASDDLEMVGKLQSVMRILNYECVAVAHNAAEAVDVVRKKKPNVVLMDLGMREADGLEASQQIVELGTTAVVLLMGEPNPARARAGMELGVSGYLLKPFEAAEISVNLESAWHHFHTVVSLREETRNLSEALEARKLVEKAKGILMEQQVFSEEEAHRWLLKMSQDQGIPLKEVCRSVIQVRMVLGKKARKAA